MTALTLFDLVIRSMRKNIKHYYLYFFALIFSVVLYFVFATLQYDPSISEGSGPSMTTAFLVAGILLLFIAGIFVVYANAIFLKRRSREIGLYQLIGLSKRKVSRLFIIENVLLSMGALIIGIVIGLLVSRLFLLLLMKLIGQSGFITVSFSLAAVIQTIIVFIAITAFTSIQMLFTVRRSTLLGLFNAEKKGEIPKKPKTFVSAILAILGIALIIYGYWLSGDMLNDQLFFNMLAVLASTIIGTYLLFRVTISWLLYQIRMRKQGHLGLNNSLSLAPLIHRMKGNANSLTIITILSAMTLTMLASSYSLYYSTDKETRYALPFDFSFEEDSEKQLIEGELSAEAFEAQLKENGIDYTSGKIEYLGVEGTYEEGVLPGFMDIDNSDVLYNTYMVSAEQLQKAGLQVDTPKEGTAIYHSVEMSIYANDIKIPFEINISSSEPERNFTVVKYGEGDVRNSGWGSQLVVNETDFEKYKNAIAAENIVHSDVEDMAKSVRVFNIVDKDQLAIASGILTQNWNEEEWWKYEADFYSTYEEAMKSNGLLIFIAGFLGLVFLISTGSILYFKQMTEAEQEKKSYTTLRQLGFTVKDIMRGIIRKQVFVFGLPLAIGLLHSVFAIKAANLLFMSDITVPASIAMGVYALIYLMFAFLTVGYYKKTVKAALR